MTSTMKHSPKKKKNLKSELKNIPKFLKTFLNGNEYSSSVAQKFFWKGHVVHMNPWAKPRRSIGHRVTNQFIKYWLILSKKT